MKGDCYARPNFPATWARMHQKGRVFYTSFGHRDDIWTNRTVQDVILGGMAWAMGNAAFDAKPNFEQVTPQANQVKN
jgi:type 1 glutamine amidotransferase